MNPSLAIILPAVSSPATTDTGHIRLGSSFRLPPAR
jgi:hypothetical protein